MSRVSASGADEDENAPKRTRTVTPVTSTVRSPSASNSSVRQPSEVNQDLREGESDAYSTYSSYDREGSYEGEQAVEEDEQSQGYGNSLSSGFGSGRYERRPVSVTLEDPDVLDCPICLLSLEPPVYQCENGHIACQTCCTSMSNKCGTCSLPIGYIRCRAMEKVLESVKIPCKNMKYGCKETISYSDIFEHDRTCNYVPCGCPHPGCNYLHISKRLYTHFGKDHSGSSTSFSFNCCISISLDDGQKYVYLQDVTDHVLFILYRSHEPRGSFVNVVCIAAPTFSERRFLYDLTARDGTTSCNLKTHVECMRFWSESASESAETSLLVPNYLLDIDGGLKLELIIRRDPVNECQSDPERDT